MEAFDVVAQKIEQVGPGVELGLGVAAGDTPEESPVRGHGLADGGGGLSLAPSRAVIDDVVLRSVGDADTEVRKNTAEFLAQRDVDGITCRHSAAADAAAVIVNTQCTKVAGVSATGHPTGKPVDHGQSILPGLDRMKRFGQLLADQRFIDHLGHALHVRNLGFTDAHIRSLVTDRGHVGRLQTIALHQKHETRWEHGSGRLRPDLRQDR